MAPIGCPETSVTSCKPTLHNIPEERRPQLHGGGSLKSRKITVSEVISMYMRGYAYVLEWKKEHNEVGISFPDIVSELVRKD